jgi:hypothetical protein
MDDVDEEGGSTSKKPATLDAVAIRSQVENAKALLAQVCQLAKQ